MSKVHQNETQAQDDRITRVAQAIFAYRYPRNIWADPLFQGEREDCLLLAVQFREILAPRWNLTNMLEQLTRGMGQVVFGDRQPSIAEQSTLTDYAKSCLEDLFGLFSGDARMKQRLSESWKYVPEDEPDDSELEVLPVKAVN